MTVERIIKEWLEANGYDGLCCEQCGCDKDDLAPCGYLGCDCGPAIKRKATADDIDDSADFEIGDEIYRPQEEREVNDERHNKNMAGDERG